MRNLIFVFILIISFYSNCWFFSKSQPIEKKQLTIILDPAGDAKHPGRDIDGDFEKTLTYQFCQELKKSLETGSGAHSDNRKRVILTRFPGETLEYLQTASFANRLHADFYLNINFYKETEKTNKIYIYYLLYNPVTDIWEKRDSNLSFIPFDQTYKTNLKTTQKLSKILVNNLKQNNFITHDAIGLPFKPLAGITAPAITIEIGLISKDSWKKLITPLSETLEIIAKNFENIE